MKIQYLGQVGFLLELGTRRIAIDPYLSASVDRLSPIWHRAYAPPLDPRALRGIDLVLCTHDHLDHTDPETLLALAQASPGCRFAGPSGAAETMRRAGLPQVETLTGGGRLKIDEVEVEALAVAHEEYLRDPAGNDQYLGYLVRWRGATLFHAGDAVHTPQLEETLAREPLAVAFLPINGRSAERRQQDIIGNMDAREAVALAHRLRTGLLVPTHFDLYPNNGARLRDFAAELEAYNPAERPRFKVFAPGETLVIEPL